MRRRFTTLFALVGLAAFSTSCGDSSPTGSHRDATSAAAGACVVDIGTLRALAATAFGGGTATTGVIRDKIDDIHADVIANDIVSAQAKARALVNYIQSHTSDLRGTPAQRDALVNTIFCWVGISESSFVVEPSPTQQVLTTNDGAGAVLLPPNAVSAPTIITITVVEGHLLTSDDTKLDRYPRSVSITSSAPVAQSTVGVCVSGVPSSVFARLRMGHRTSEGFKIEPPAPVDFLSCPTSGSSASAAKGVRGFLRSLASMVLPKVAYAKMQDELRSGGVGGTAGEYSPFEPVDTELRLSGGVGGTAGEYIRSPLANTVAGGVCTANEAPVGTALEPECRPRVQVTTANGTVLEDVPVTWAITGGAGSTATDNPLTRACGTFGATAANVTNVNGKAGACWTLGTQIGANTLVATVGTGGDAPVGVSFNPPTRTFTANGVRITPTATAIGETVSYDGASHPGNGSCTDGLSPMLSYSGDGTVPKNVGSYVLTVTCGAGSSFANVATATAGINITTGAPAITISCPASVVFSNAPQTPCTATIRAPGLDLTATPTYATNVNAGTAKATVVFAGSTGYAPATASKDFVIARAPTTTSVTCPLNLVYTSAALTPCAATVIGASVSLTPTPTYSNNTNVGTAGARFDYTGDANHLPSSDAQTFAITPAPSVTTVSCASVVYNGAVQNPCTAAVTGVGALNQSLGVSYTSAAPRNAGGYSASATFAGDLNHTGSTASNTFTISPLGVTATAGSGTMTLGGAVPALPCTVNVLPVDAGSVTCTSSLPGTLSAGTNTTTPIVSPANPANYALSPVNGMLSVTYAQANCFDWPLSNTLPHPSLGVSQGPVVGVGCSLRNAQNGFVTNAWGSLRVDNVGPNGTSTPQQVSYFADGFYYDSGLYSAKISTDDLTTGRYYRVTATWNDGSTTVGYFYLSPN